eukprot:5453591-Amphidinium_carterae.1
MAESRSRANRLGRKLKLRRSVVDALAWTGVDSLKKVMQQLKLLELENGAISYKAAEPEPEPPAERADDSKSEGGQTLSPSGSPTHNRTAADFNLSVALDNEDIDNEQAERPVRELPEDGKLYGIVRKWDSERGFGFIVQDAKDADEQGKDIFVHRKNVIGSTPSNHLDLKEGSRISYRRGEQDGRPRALEAAMIDEDGQPLPLHIPSRTPDAKGHGRWYFLNAALSDPDNVKEELPRTVLAILQRPAVQDSAKKEEAEAEA